MPSREASTASLHLVPPESRLSAACREPATHRRDRDDSHCVVKRECSPSGKTPEIPCDPFSWPAEHRFIDSSIHTIRRARSVASGSNCKVSSTSRRRSEIRVGDRLAKRHVESDTTRPPSRPKCRADRRSGLPPSTPRTPDDRRPISDLGSAKSRVGLVAVRDAASAWRGPTCMSRCGRRLLPNGRRLAAARRTRSCSRDRSGPDRFGIGLRRGGRSRRFQGESSMQLD